MKQTIVAFDFDGTITSKDTLREIIKKTHRPLQIIGNILLASPFLLLYRIGLLSNGKAKQILFSIFYKNWLIKQFNDRCLSFKSSVDDYIRPDVYQKLKQHQAAGHQVIIVSASVENWIIPWAEKENIKTVLATQVEISLQGRLTGRFLSENCYGKEKAKRILEQFPDRENYILVAYGDSRGDQEMLRLADKSYYLK